MLNGVQIHTHKFGKLTISKVGYALQEKCTAMSVDKCHIVYGSLVFPNPSSITISPANPQSFFFKNITSEKWRNRI